MMIFGFTLGSVLIVFKEIYDSSPGSMDIALGAVTFAVGVLISLWFSRIGKKTSKELAAR
jgi:protein-S-isoprenylcysteine O-methyltransferase Ste14